MSFIVTGTGTGVGKTIVSALILTRYGKRGQLAYWKPIATGSEEESDTRTVVRLAPRGVEVLPEVYSYGPPVSPHLAARLARRPIEPALVVEAFVAHAAGSAERNLLVEGVGGLLVPLTDRGLLLADLLAELHLPLLVVASSQLGTINHTLLTLEAARARRLLVAGVVLSGPRNPENRAAIERFGKVEVLAEALPIPSVTRDGIARAARTFDRKGRIKELLS